MRSCSNYSRNSTPNIPKRQIKPESVHQKKATKGSPIINPIVLRPCPSPYVDKNISNASASNLSTIIVKKPVYGGIQKKPEQPKGMFSPDKINNAF